MDLDSVASELMVAEHKDHATVAVLVEPYEAAEIDLVADVVYLEASHKDHGDREFVALNVASSSVFGTQLLIVVLVSSAS